MAERKLVALPISIASDNQIEDWTNYQISPVMCNDKNKIFWYWGSLGVTYLKILSNIWLQNCFGQLYELVKKNPLPKIQTTKHHNFFLQCHLGKTENISASVVLDCTGFSFSIMTFYQINIWNRISDYLFFQYSLLLQSHICKWFNYFRHRLHKDEALWQRALLFHLKRNFKFNSL